jgi:hypothetical protein
MAAHRLMMMTAKISSFVVIPMVTTCKHEEGLVLQALHLSLQPGILLASVHRSLLGPQLR